MMPFWECPWFRALTELLWGIAVNCEENKLNAEGEWGEIEEQLKTRGENDV